MQQQQDLLILDGGICHLLKSRGIEKLASELEYDELFAAGSLANADHPDLIRSVHEDYIQAGCDIITTNTFGCTEWSLGKIGRGELAITLAGDGAKLAKEVASKATAATGKTIYVAGSLPPLMESYQTRDLYAFEQMQPHYRSLVSALASHVDLFLCETMATTTEALAAGTAAADSGKPWWVSFTLEDTTHAHLRSGETLQSAVAAIQDLPGLECVLVNCSAPQAVTAAVPILRQCTPAHLRVGAYANGFATTTSEWLAQGSDYQTQLEVNKEDYEEESGVIKVESYARFAKGWVEAGASVAGGCCGIGPEHIAQLVKDLKLNPN